MQRLAEAVPGGYVALLRDDHKQPMNKLGVKELVALLALHKRCTLDKSWNVEHIYLHLRHDTRRHLVDVTLQQPAEAVLRGYVETLQDHHKQLMACKLGVSTSTSGMTPYLM